MLKLGCIALVLLLAGCATTDSRPASGCIPGDPGGSPACQQKAYLLAF